MLFNNKLPVVVGEEVYHKSRGKRTVSKIERNEGYINSKLLNNNKQGEVFDGY